MNNQPQYKSITKQNKKKYDNSSSVYISLTLSLHIRNADIFHVSFTITNILMSNFMMDVQ